MNHYHGVGIFYKKYKEREREGERKNEFSVHNRSEVRQCINL